MARSERPRIAGSVYPNTAEGFERFLQEANRVSRDGYDLVTLVPLEKGKLGAVFRRQPSATPEDTSAFFE